MSEHEPRKEGEHNAEASPHFDADRLAEALGVPEEQRFDVAYGAGIGFRVGHERSTGIEFYPDTSVVRLTTGRARIELFGNLVPTPQADGVLVEQVAEAQILSLGLTANGEVMFTAEPRERETPPEAREPAQELPGPSNQMTSHLDQSGGSVANPGAPEGPSGNESNADQTAEAEERRRVTIRGRVGAVPSFRQTPRGVHIGRFPLAVHVDEQTQWHTVLTFNKRTGKLRDAQLAKGQQVEVTGYIHRRTQPAREGKTKVVEEIYAVVVKPR